ncbi:hypothetical protein CROQUDRAFT_672635 [Cronartium quercuum f. sp. fusiforme G11]|uniref:Transmembrane protein n=1 Tax=Cronartium quercuum f. sp. fusiforme G11 TaxID=708437 RepID=A0A9P6NDL8_9BASI|nr:hypothetical protein CROQUDRAFT_672635 [Cronartium quercuum f. sp. fusiforme G11]
MVYAPRPNHQGSSPTDGYALPRSTGNVGYYDGAYGRDGAPPSKFIRPLESAYRPPPPQRQNIAPAQPHARLYHDTVSSPPRRPAHPQAIPPPGPYAPRHSPSPVPEYARSGSPSPAYPRSQSAASPPPPIYQDVREEYHHYSQDTKMSAPRPVFVDSNTKQPDRSGAGLGQTNGLFLPEKLGPTYSEMTAGEEVWRRIGRDKQDKPDNTWLSRQYAAGSKFKSKAWMTAILVLGLIAGVIAFAVTRHPSTPRALSWANGASDVPTFGHNSTTATTNVSNNHIGSSSDQINNVVRTKSTRFRARDQSSSTPQVD